VAGVILSEGVVGFSGPIGDRNAGFAGSISDHEAGLSFFGDTGVGWNSSDVTRQLRCALLERMKICSFGSDSQRGQRLASGG